MSLEFVDVCKSFLQGSNQVHVLDRVHFSLPQGRTAAILGPSGVGKSTFLSLAAGLDLPNSGEVKVDGQVINNLGEERLAGLRAEKIGFVFQQFHLISHLTALENVTFPLLLAQGGRNSDNKTSADNARSSKSRISYSEIEKSAGELLESVGLGHRLHHLPSQLSGGECQRVAIARALIHKPKLVLADEPSGNLDSETGDKVIRLLFEMIKKQSASLVMVTHNRELADFCDIQFEMSKGHVERVPTQREQEQEQG